MILRHTFDDTDNRRLAHLCGALDAHLRRVEEALDVKIQRRDAAFRVEGAKAAAQAALDLLLRLHERAAAPLSAQEVQLSLLQALRAGRGGAQRTDLRPAGAAKDGTQAPTRRPRGSGAQGMAAAPQAAADGVAPARATGAAVAGPGQAATKGLAAASAGANGLANGAATGAGATTSAADGAAVPGAEGPLLHTRRADLRGRTSNQVDYLHKILGHDLTFGIGPAGTGKTFLAVACAVDALERSQVQRIVLTRPAVEAGERLGFLPGDLAQKVDPYLRPLYDALYDLMGFDRVTKAFEKGLLEIAPLAFMRGRTLNHAFVILDEAQNTTPEQMKMFLTRIGFGSRAVVTGDVSQIDLPKGSHSGLVEAVRVLRRTPGIAMTHFDASDVVRHPLVARIVEAYAAHEAARGTREGE